VGDLHGAGKDLRPLQVREISLIEAMPELKSLNFSGFSPSQAALREN
jgi:hypothetical protein